jgi:hypothetical protein
VQASSTLSRLIARVADKVLLTCKYALWGDARSTDPSLR